MVLESIRHTQYVDDGFLLDTHSYFEGWMWEMVNKTSAGWKIELWNIACQRGVYLGPWIVEHRDTGPTHGTNPCNENHNYIDERGEDLPVKIKAEIGDIFLG